MKVDTLTNINNKLTTNNESLSHKIEIGDPEIILSYMRKESYKYHLRTAIQEYLSNALDANREVKQTKRCEVFAPTNENPTLIIKDYGPGISPSRMENIFCKVGVSTSRKSQTAKGGFGAGSKVGLAYCDTVIIITNVDGLKYVYNLTVSRNPGGEVLLMGTPSKTNDPNGTEIHLPIKNVDIERSYRAIQRFCFFTSVNETPTCHNLPDKYKKTIHDCNTELIGTLNDKMSTAYLAVGNEIPVSSVLETSSDCIIVLDGIPYPLDHELKKPLLKVFEKLNYKTLVIHFKNGVLDPQLSREGLQNNEKNQKAISFLANLVEKNIEKEIQEMLDTENSLSAKIEAFKKISKKYSERKVDYKHYSISAYEKFPNGVMITTSIFKNLIADRREADRNGKLRPMSRKKEFVGLPFCNKNIFVAELNKESKVKIGQKINYLARLHRDYLFKSNSNSSLSVEMYVIYKTDEVSDKDFNNFVSDFDIKSLHDIEIPKEELSRNEVVRYKKSKEEITLHTLYKESEYQVSKVANKTTIDELSDSNKKYAYITLDDLSKSRHTSLEMEKLIKLREFFTDHTFVAIGKADLEKIKKNELANFFTLTEIMDNYKYNQAHYNHVFFNDINREDYLRYLSDIHKVSPLKNKTILKALEIYQNNCKRVSVTSMPESIEKMYKNDPKMVKELNLIKKFDILIQEDNLFKCSIDSMKNEEQKKELAVYLNWKHK